jgi:radical SAM protein (TIGR01212 family)
MKSGFIYSDDNKRYHTQNYHLRHTFGEKVAKISLDAGFTCPNRDGKVGRGGCTYCDNAAFHPSYSTAGKSLHQQMDEGIEFHKVRYRTTEHYLAYFQSFSNTYAPLERLRELYEEALTHPQVVGIVIGTRPDCVDEQKLDYLADLAHGRVLKGWSRHLMERVP